MYQYELLLDTIRKRRYELQKKKERLLTGEEMLLFLRRDNVRVLEKIKEMQEAYYNKATIPKSEYTQKSSLYKNQLAQNEKESAVIEARVQQEIMLKEQLRKEISENIHLFNNHQMKKPAMQNIEEIIANVLSYAYLVSKEAMKWSLFSAKEMYDLLLLRMLDMHKTMGNKEREKQKEVQEDFAVAKELLEMLHAEKKQYNKDRIHPWHVREIAEKGKHAVDAASITLSWFWKKKKTEVSQYMQKNYMQKQWSWKEAYQYLCYRSYFLLEEWKWRCKDFFLQVKV